MPDKITLDMIDLDGFEVEVHGKHGFTPKQAEPGSVGYDLYLPPGKPFSMPYNSRRLVDTGVVVKTPIKLFMLLVPRSSTGTKRAHSVRIANTVGVIDPSYQGPNDTLKVNLEREDRKKEYLGTFQYVASAVNNSVKAQAFAHFDAPMGEQTEIVSLNDDNWYDVFSYVEESPIVFEPESRFAQVIFIPYARPDLVVAELEKFDGPDRGGFGSTGE